MIWPYKLNRSALYLMRLQSPRWWIYALHFVRLAFTLASVSLYGCSTLDYDWDEKTIMPHASLRVPAEINEELAASPPCCSSLTDLPYQPISRQGKIDVKIGNDSPIFEFDTGKSYFSAFRLPDWPRPLIIQVDSFRTTDPNSLWGLIPIFNQVLIFHPEVLILDDHYRITQTIEQFSYNERCLANGFPSDLNVQFEIGTPPAESAYMVIMTTDTLRKKQITIGCGIKVKGFSPIGNLEVRLLSLGFGDGNIAYKAPYVWYRNAHGSDDVGILSGFFKDSGLLLVTGDGIHYVEWKLKGYVERFFVPNERIISVNTDRTKPQTHNNLLVLGIAGKINNTIEYHTFSGAQSASTDEAKRLIRPRIQPFRFTEKVGMSVAQKPPMMNILEAKVRTDAANRIGESAAAGGYVMAAPCGLCQAGVCPPEVLAPCAALFAVGAAIGGVVGAGSELISGGLAETPNLPQLSEADVAITLPALKTASTSGITGKSFRQCVARHLKQSSRDRTSGNLWTSQGRRAEVSDVDAEAPAADNRLHYPALRQQGYRFVAEIHIDAVNLISRGISGQSVAEMPVHLQIVGELHFYDLIRNITRDLPLEWEGDSQTWSTLSADTPLVLKAVLDQACNELARKAIEKTEVIWKNW
jgi:hypothetical protein